MFVVNGVPGQGVYVGHEVVVGSSQGATGMGCRGTLGREGCGWGIAPMVWWRRLSPRDIVGAAGGGVVRGVGCVACNGGGPK